MNAILKINEWKDTLPVLFIFHVGGNCEAKLVGKAKKKYYEILIEQKKLPEIPFVKIIDTHYKNIEMMNDVVNCKFYEIRLITKR